MSVPTHSPGCKTKVWETSCPRCGEHVFFFLCTCGSKVFFDDLGDPWPQHEDSCVASRIHELRDSVGLSLDDVERLVEAEAVRRGTKVPANAKTIFRSLNYKETGKGTLLTLTPGHESREFTGTIDGTNQRVNFFKRLRLEDMVIGRGILGDLVTEEYRDVYIKGQTDPRTGYRPQIEAVISRSILERIRVGIGVRVTAQLEPRNLPGGAKLWIVDDIWNED